MNNHSPHNKDLFLILLDRVRPVWDFLRTRLFALDERTRLNLLLTIFNLMLLIIVVFALLNRSIEIRYETVVQTATMAHATAAAAQTAVYKDGFVEGGTQAVAEVISQLAATASAQSAATLTPDTRNLDTPSADTPTPETPTPNTPTPETPTPNTPTPETPTPDTPTPETPTPDTPTPETPTPDTPTPETPTPSPAPAVLGIEPNEGTNTVRVPVVITGTNFFGTPTARLGSSSSIDISAAMTDMLTGEIRVGLVPGVYDLTVTNPDGQSDTLLQAFTVYDFSGDDIPLESPSLVTFGGSSEPPYDDTYQVQVTFFELPSNLPPDPLYLRVFDPDTGHREDEKLGDEFDTVISYTLYGGAGASVPDITSGLPILKPTIGISEDLDGGWHSIGRSFLPSEGDSVGDRYIFKLAVEGGSGNDVNWYQVALSRLQDTNAITSSVKMFAYTWVLAVSDTNRPNLHPYVGEGVQTFRLRSFGCDGTEGRLLIRTPSRILEARCSGGSFEPTEWPVEGEDSTTWTVDFSEYASSGTDYLGCRVEDESGESLRVFTRPTTAAPP